MIFNILKPFISEFKSVVIQDISGDFSIRFWRQYVSLFNSPYCLFPIEKVPADTYHLPGVPIRLLIHKLHHNLY